MPFAPIDEALESLRKGDPVIVVDDPDHANEGELCLPGETATPERVNFLLQHGKGLPCVATTAERLSELRIPLMTKTNTSRRGVQMGETVDSASATNGVSAPDRAKTIAVFCDPEARPEALNRPGHTIPLLAVQGGVLRRAGHTEASVDLARLAGFAPVGVLCELLDERGEMMRVPEIEAFAARHGLKVVTIADLITYRRKTERLVERVAGPIPFPTKFGEFTIYGYDPKVEAHPYIAIVKGDVATDEPTLVRMHSSCLTGDLLGSLRCDCGDQLAAALTQIDQEGRGVVVYIAQEGRGIGILNKLRAYELQDQGLDTVEANEALGFKADLRDYGLGAQVLADLGLRRLRLMTNNPAKVKGLQGYGLEIVEHVPMISEPCEHRKRYLETKRDKMGHWIE